jgi:hypothetical protein
LMHRKGTLAVRGAEAVRASVAAAEDHHALAGREDLAGDGVARHDLVLLGQEVHREVDPGELAARHAQVARLGRAAREHDRVELAAQLGRVHIRADVHAGAEGHALGLHLRHPPVDEVLLHLEVGDAVAQESADPVRALEHRHRVASARELLGASETRGPGPDHGDPLAGGRLGWVRRDEVRLPGVVDDLLLDLLDRDRIVVDVQDARLLAGGGADAARELGEVVGRVQALDRVAPASPIDQIVPVGDDVPERAALVAEGDAAVHAARPLSSQLVLGELALELAPILQALLDRPAVRQVPLDLEESGDLSHQAPVPTMRVQCSPSWLRCWRAWRRRCRGVAWRGSSDTRPGSP